MRQWLLRPSTSLTVIKQRHDAVACLVDPENILIADKLHKNIGGLKGAPLALNRLKKGKATLQNWKAVVQEWFNQWCVHIRN
jgi:DNA mismatch repair protein MSH5